MKILDPYKKCGYEIIMRLVRGSWMCLFMQKSAWMLHFDSTTPLPEADLYLEANMYKESQTDKRSWMEKT